MSQDLWERRANTWGDRFSRHPIGWSITVLLVVVLLGGLLGLATGWISFGTKFLSPAELREQYRTAFTLYNSLEASAQNVCDLEELISDETDPDVKSQRESQLLAFQQQYNANKATYEARMQNIFEAKKRKPAELPFEAPTLEEMKQLVCA